jgi:phosphopentomutase
MMCINVAFEVKAGHCRECHAYNATALKKIDKRWCGVYMS